MTTLAHLPRTPIHGVHHTARPTWKLRETVEFYRDKLGLPLVHAISARGWPEGHPDFLHFFFDSGNGSTIAFFYYIGTERPENLVPFKSHFYTATHTAWQVQKLEDELGVKIFDRSKQPVQTTEIGQTVIDQARMILGEAGNLKKLVAQQKGTISGELRIGIIPTLAPYLLPLFLNQFLKKYQEQQSRTGSLFDPVPAPLEGNVYNEANPSQLALGYFSAAGVYRKRYVFDPGSTDLDLILKLPPRRYNPNNGDYDFYNTLGPCTEKYKGAFGLGEWPPAGWATEDLNN